MLMIEEINTAVPILGYLSPVQIQELTDLTYQAYLATDEWRQIREVMLQLYSRCQLCGCDEGLEVHHNNYGVRGRETLGDLLVACNRCHKAITVALDPGEQEWLDAPGAWTRDVSERLEATTFLIDNEPIMVWQGILELYRNWLEKGISFTGEPE